MNVKVYNATIEDGKIVTTEPKIINPHRCPHYILVGEHYRDDGSCKCDDPKDPNMKDWGYKWSKSERKWK